ncbi:MAG: alpha/beta hydrolase [Bacteroidota bacterium]
MKLTGITLFLVLNCFIPSLMGQHLVLPLYSEGSIPEARQSSLKEIRDTTDILRISQVIIPEISVYLPAVPHRTGEAVVICPGGGYRVLAWDWEGEDLAKFWNSKGLAAIVLKYRLPSSESQINPSLVPLLDAQRAMRLARYHAADWGIDPDRIGIMGFSAGGHLASTLSTQYDSGNPADPDPVERMSCRPGFSMLIYPVISMTEKFQHSGSREALVGNDNGLAKKFSSELQVTPDTPPAFLLHASDDQVVPVENSLAYYQALIRNGVAAEMHIYPEGGHGFALAIGKGHLAGWPELCHQWLRSLYKEEVHTSGRQ